jgi:hypothetical protein
LRDVTHDHRLTMLVGMIVAGVLGEIVSVIPLLIVQAAAYPPSACSSSRAALAPPMRAPARERDPQPEPRRRELVAQSN